jgi:glycosyltransferase involved in cell wall biosynthesis
MALKKPVLASAFGDLEKYFIDGEDIFIARSLNPECIAEKIDWILQNKELAKAIALAGFEKAHKLLDYNTSMNRISDFVNRL